MLKHFLATFVIFLGIIPSKVEAQLIADKSQFSYMRLWYTHPARYFEESIPIGNGKLGACVYGDPKNEKIYLNDITFWTGKPVDKDEGAGKAKWVAKIREALAKEDYRKADSLQHFLQGNQSANYMPLGTLLIHNMNEEEVKYYKRELDLDKGVATTTYRQGRVRYQWSYFVSHPDRLIAIHIDASEPGKISQEIKLTSQVPHHIKASNGQLVMVSHALGEEKESVHACTVVRVFTKGGRVSYRDSTLILEKVDEATLYIVNETSFNGFDKHPVKEGKDYLDEAMTRAWHCQNYAYRDFLNHHLADYQRIHDRMYLQLGTEKPHCSMPTDELLWKYSQAPDSLLDSDKRYLETLYFQYGRYLLQSCSRTKGVPANLQGLWSPYLHAPWRSNYTMNINTEENYWPAMEANMAEMIQPLFGFMKGLSWNGAYTAKNFYGVKEGWCSSHNSDPWCKTAPVGEGKESPEWANWNLSGAWLMSNLWDYYLHTQDKECLRDSIYPLMEGAVAFFKSWLVPNPKNLSEYITSPSTSPENEYITPEGYHGTTCYGGTADLAIIRELFLNYLSAQKVLKIKPDKTVSYLLSHLHPYTIGKQGDLNEWYYDWEDWDPKHRHQSHLIGLYPGLQIMEMGDEGTLDGRKQAKSKQKADGQALLKASNGESKGTLLRAIRQTLLQKGDESTGWSTGWRINLWARLRDGEYAYKIYQNLLRYVSPEGDTSERALHRGGTYPNLFDAHPPFQIDGNFGGTAGVCEMLVQSIPDLSKQDAYDVYLLPALPKEWANGKVIGICARGGIELKMSWRNSQVESIEIVSKANTLLRVHYNGKISIIKAKRGLSYSLQ